MTLRQRLTGAIVLLVLMTCALVAGWSLHVAQREMLETIGRQQFALLSSAAAYLETDLSHKRTLLRTVADSMDGGACAHVQADIERYSVLRQHFSNVVAFDRSGILIAGLRDWRTNGKQQFADRPYFKETIRTLKGVTSEPLVSKLSNKPVVLITEPVFDREGKISCVLAGSIDLAQPAFFGQIAQLRPGRTGYLFALTSSGLILHHPNLQRLSKNILTEPGPPVPSTVNAMGGWEGWVLGQSKSGTPAIMTYKHMRTPAWIVGSVYPLDEAFSSVSAARHAAIIGAVCVALCAGLIGWYITQRLLRPLQRLRENVVAVEQGEADIDVFNFARQDEVGALARALYSLSDKRRVAEAQLAQLASTDMLTGLGNRRRLYSSMLDIAARAKRTRMPVALAFLDIDHFKQINDQYGHEVGDFVLKEFGTRLLACVRKTDHVFRLAGDEFVIVFEHVNDVAGMDDVVHGILDAVRAPFCVDKHALSVTTSIGMATSHCDEVELDVLLQRADAALYTTKQRGRNGYTSIFMSS